MNFTFRNFPRSQNVHKASTVRFYSLFIHSFVKSMYFLRRKVISNKILLVNHKFVAVDRSLNNYLVGVRVNVRFIACV